jgi:hypothetical protein
VFNKHVSCRDDSVQLWTTIVRTHDSSYLLCADPPNNCAFNWAANDCPHCSANHCPANACTHHNPNGCTHSANSDSNIGTHYPAPHHLPANACAHCDTNGCNHGANISPKLCAHCPTTNCYPADAVTNCRTNNSTHNSRTDWQRCHDISTDSTAGEQPPQISSPTTTTAVVTSQSSSSSTDVIVVMAMMGWVVSGVFIVFAILVVVWWRRERNKLRAHGQRMPPATANPLFSRVDVLSDSAGMQDQEETPRNHTLSQHPQPTTVYDRSNEPEYSGFSNYSEPAYSTAGEHPHSHALYATPTALPVESRISADRTARAVTLDDNLYVSTES